LLRPGRRVKKGAKLLLSGDGLQKHAVVLDDGREDSCQRILEFAEDCSFEDLKVLGHIPLPPYINRPDEPRDREVYQTVFAREEGAVASPTAGLHFDQPLLTQLKAKGVEVVTVTLHVGYGTFQTIPVEELSEHQMFEEAFELTESAADRINLARREKRRIIACGTTVVRTLESCADASGQVRPQQGSTRLFIYPSYEFKVPSGMITNFHLPKSSLLLLVAAFLGWDKTRAAYEEAVRQQYRFYSYGDAMLIL
jgi:S-adenosylmethionine:tRNA ribosyltransferase-isomerase